MPRHPVNPYSGPYVDRASELRKDPAWVAAALADPASFFVPVWRQRNLVRAGDSPGAVFVRHEVFAETLLAVSGAAADPAAATAVSRTILLGRFEGRACFAVELEGDEPPRLAEASEFADLRTAGAQLPATEAGLLAYARAMVHWRSRHRFCGVCGAPAAPANAGHVMRCTNPACAADAFPRLDPAIIVLVHDGDRALLGRQASWPPGRYSTIAGFVEPGESLEDAVAREVLEEAGVEVDEVQYHSSQPWPFPSSLMVGFLATADAARGVRVDGDELEDARWFTRAEIANGTPVLPPPQSISYRLIQEWYDRAGGTRLADAPGARLWILRR
ncbi:MAG: NAD(+) diphosphatase [Steroidobacteraceae bacterium]|nr:NAD(+) diphosphatase [Steroidobacteraceae bacterium]